MGQYLPVFVLSSSQIKYKLKSGDLVPGIRTRGRRMVGTDVTTGGLPAKDLLSYFWSVFIHDLCTTHAYLLLYQLCINYLYLHAYLLLFQGIWKLHLLKIRLCFRYKRIWKKKSILENVTFCTFYTRHWLWFKFSHILLTSMISIEMDAARFSFCRVLSILERDSKLQCDQIWQNSTTLANI